jgi:hypothetical protein
VGKQSTIGAYFDHFSFQKARGKVLLNFTGIYEGKQYLRIAWPLPVTSWVQYCRAVKLQPAM